MSVITGIDFYRYNLALREPFVISLETISEAANLLVCIHTSSGLTGWGECSPFASINGEVQISQFALAPWLGKMWLGQSIHPVEERIQALDSAILGNQNLKSAFDMALYDLLAQEQELPLYKYLLGTPREVTTDMTIGLRSVQETVSEAERLVGAGFNALKLKLGTSVADDVQRLTATRQAIGPQIALRADANQGWSRDQALEVLEAAYEVSLDHCEEPLPKWDLGGQAWLTALSPVPIMADESLHQVTDAFRLIDYQACHRFNLKLGKSGGLWQARRIMHLAQKHNIPCQVGCFIESRLATTALLHFVYAQPDIVLFDMDSPLLLHDDPVLGGMRYTDGGFIRLWDDSAVGLGAVPDPVFLKKLEKISLR